MKGKVMKAIFSICMSLLLTIAMIGFNSATYASELTRIEIKFNSDYPDLNISKDDNGIYYQLGNDKKYFNPSSTLLVLSTSGVINGDLSVNINAELTNTDPTLNIELNNFKVYNHPDKYIYSSWNHGGSVDVNLFLEGDNQIIVSKGRPALSVPYGVTYHISGDQNSSIELSGLNAIGVTDGAGGKIIVDGEATLITSNSVAADVVDNTEGKTWIEHVVNAEGIKPGDIYYDEKGQHTVSSVNHSSFVADNENITLDSVKAIGSIKNSDQLYVYGADDTLLADNLPSGLDKIKFINDYTVNSIHDYSEYAGDVNFVLEGHTLNVKNDLIGVNQIIGKWTGIGTGYINLYQGVRLNADYIYQIDVTIDNIGDIVPIEISADYPLSYSVKIILSDPKRDMQDVRLIDLGYSNQAVETNEMQSLRDGIEIYNADYVLKHESYPENGGYHHYFVLDYYVVKIDKNTFPDPVFRQYISDEIDISKDGWLSPNEIKNVRYIYISDTELHSLEGIEIFTELTSLNCQNNQIEAIDLSKLENLMEIDLSNNCITSIVLPDDNGMHMMVMLDGQKREMAVEDQHLLIDDLGAYFDLSKTGSWKLNGSDIDMDELFGLNGKEAIDLSPNDTISYMYSYGPGTYDSFDVTLEIKISIAAEAALEGKMYEDETVSVSISGMDSQYKDQLSYKWYRQDHLGDIEYILDTNDDVYKITGDDIGYNLGVIVSYDKDGFYFQENLLASDVIKAKDSESPQLEGADFDENYYTTQYITISDDNLSEVKLNGVLLPFLSRSGNSLTIKLDGDRRADYVIEAKDSFGNKTSKTLRMYPIASLTAGLADESEITTDYRPVLEDLRDDINSIILKNANTATEAEKALLKNEIAKIDELLSIIDQIDNKAEIVDEVKDIDKDNVSAGDKDKLETAKDAIEAILDDYSGNITEEEKIELENKLDQINDALDLINRVEAIEQIINGLGDKIDVADQKQVELVKEALSLYDGLSAHGQEMVAKNIYDKMMSLKSQIESGEIIVPDTSSDNLNNCSIYSFISIIIIGIFIGLYKRKYSR